MISGTLSNPSKMPCHGYSIPASRCITGQKLAMVEGSVCEGCYALKNFYAMDSVQDALEFRFSTLNDPRWVDALVKLIGKSEFFRWHDSGDLQSVEHFSRIVEVCERTPATKHWLPTREYRFVMLFIQNGGVIPSNLVVRFSAHMRDAAPPSGYGLPTSTVHSSEPDSPFTILNMIPATSHYCPAGKQGNKCLSCRACWDATVANVSYHVH